MKRQQALEKRVWLVFASLVVAACSSDEPEPLQEIALAPRILLRAPAGWTLAAKETGDYKLRRRDANRIQEIDIALYASAELGVAAEAATTLATAEIVAQRTGERILAESRLPALYQSFLEGYNFDSFDTVSHAGHDWGIYTQKRVGKKTQYWTCLFTAHAEDYVVVLALYDADAAGQGVGLEAWRECLSAFELK